MIVNEAVKSQIREKLKKQHYIRCIRAIIGYGSWTRGNYDEDSDIDILVIEESGNFLNVKKEKLVAIFQEVAPGRQIDLSIYDSAKFETLLTCGSLFLHHVKKEGEILYSKKRYTKEYLFGKLNEFKGVSEDMLLYHRMFMKVQNNINIYGINYFDINILSLLARNVMILICYLKGDQTYGKHEVYDKCKELMGQNFTLNKDVYEELLAFRNYFNRKLSKVVLPEFNRCEQYLEEIQSLIMLGIDLIGVHNTIDRIFFILEDGVGRNFYTSFEIFSDFDRDIFVYLNRYMKRYYNTAVDSIRDPFLVELISKYSKDEFIECVCNVMEEFKNVKEKSSNYTLDIPDIYSEIHVKRELDMEKWDILEKLSSFFMRGIGKKPRKNIVQLLEELRNQIVSQGIQ